MTAHWRVLHSKLLVVLSNCGFDIDEWCENIGYEGLKIIFLRLWRTNV